MFYVVDVMKRDSRGTDIIKADIVAVALIVTGDLNVFIFCLFYTIGNIFDFSFIDKDAKQIV